MIFCVLGDRELPIVSACAKLLEDKDQSLKWAFKLGEAYTGATWFWATEGLDTGDICEQEVLAILPDERPREFYERAVIPSALRMLGYIVDDVRNGIVRRRPQQHENATFEPGIKKTEPTTIVS